MIVYRGTEFDLDQIEMDRVPSRLNSNEWRYRARCTVKWCRAWIWYNFEGAKITSCEHNAGFMEGKLLIKKPKELEA